MVDYRYAGLDANGAYTELGFSILVLEEEVAVRGRNCEATVKPRRESRWRMELSVTASEWRGCKIEAVDRAERSADNNDGDRTGDDTVVCVELWRGMERCGAD